MYEEFFYNRLTELRIQKNVSAREMSLAIGQNPNYINGIESKKFLPSINGFFYICEYFNITPEEFFNEEVDSPVKIKELNKYANALNEQQLEHILAIIKDIIDNKK